MVSQFLLSIFSGEVTFRSEVWIVGSHLGHKGPVGRCGMGAALAEASAGASKRRELGSK